VSEFTGDVGIDIGGRRLAYGWPYFGMVGSFDLGKKGGMSRDAELRAMRAWLNAALPHGVQLWIDIPFAGNGGVAAAQMLSETVGMVLSAQEWLCPPIMVHSSTWKSALLGNHLAGKDELSGWLHDRDTRLWTRCQTQDEIDAAVIGIYGQERAAGRILPPEPKKRRKARMRT